MEKAFCEAEERNHSKGTPNEDYDIVAPSNYWVFLLAVGIVMMLCWRRHMVAEVMSC